MIVFNVAAFVFAYFGAMLQVLSESWDSGDAADRAGVVVVLLIAAGLALWAAQ